MASPSSNDVNAPPRSRSESISKDVKDVVDMGVQAFAMGAASEPSVEEKRLLALYAYALGKYLTVAEVKAYAKTVDIDEKTAARCFVKMVQQFPDGLGKKYFDETTAAVIEEQKEEAKRAEERRTESGAHAGSSSTDA